MAEGDVYASERARLATEQAAKIRMKRELQARQEERSRLEEIANAEIRQAGVDAWRELKSAGFRPARFVTGRWSTWRAAAIFRDTSVAGQYWVAHFSHASVLVSERGMFGNHLRFHEDSTLRAPVVVASGPHEYVLDLSPVKVNQEVSNVFVPYQLPLTPTIRTDGQGHAMIDKLPIAVAVARGVVEQIAQGNK